MTPECHGRPEELSALLDGELGADEELALRRHLDTCPSCQIWRGQLLDLSTGIAACLGRERAPQSLARRIESLAPRRNLRLGRAAAAAVFAAVAASLFLLLPGSELPVERLLLADHHKLVSGGTTLAVPSSNADEVARELRARLPFAVHVRAVEGAELRGGHACSIAGKRAAYLQYVHAGEAISVFVFPSRGDDAGAAAACRELDGETLCSFAGPHERVAVVASSSQRARAFRDAARVVAEP